MDEVVTTNEKSTKLKDKEIKLKESIKKYYSQLKTGCYRILCYNEFCKKGKGNYAIYFI